jgi:hypothetical protein
MTTMNRLNLGDEYKEIKTGEFYYISKADYSYSDLGHRYDLVGIRNGVWIRNVSQTDMLARFVSEKFTEDRPFINITEYTQVLYHPDYDDSGRVYDVTRVTYEPVSATEFEYVYTLTPPKNALWHEYPDGEQVVSEAKMRAFSQRIRPYDEPPFPPRPWIERYGFDIAYKDLEKMICEAYAIDEFDSMKNEGWKPDDYEQVYTTNIILTPEDRKNIAEFIHQRGYKPEHMVSTLLLDMVRRRVIPDGTWNVSVYEPEED